MRIVLLWLWVGESSPPFGLVYLSPSIWDPTYGFFVFAITPRVHQRSIEPDLKLAQTTHHPLFNPSIILKFPPKSQFEPYHFVNYSNSAIISLSILSKSGLFVLQLLWWSQALKWMLLKNIFTYTTYIIIYACLWSGKKTMPRTSFWLGRFYHVRDHENYTWCIITYTLDIIMAHYDLDWIGTLWKFHKTGTVNQPAS